MHAAEALWRHERVLHAAGLVLCHRLNSDKHHEEQNTQGVAVHLGGVVLSEDDLRGDKAGGAHHAAAVGLLAEVKDHSKVHELHDLHRRGL